MGIQSLTGLCMMYVAESEWVIIALHFVLFLELWIYESDSPELLIFTNKI